MSRKTVMGVALVFASGLVLSAAGVAVASADHREPVSAAVVHDTQGKKPGHGVAAQESPVEAGDESAEPICVEGDAPVPAGAETHELEDQEGVTPLALTEEPLLLPGEEALNPHTCAAGATEMTQSETATTVPVQASLGNG